MLTTAHAIAATVHDGTHAPADVLAAHLARAGQAAAVGAFVHLDPDYAAREAARVAGELAALPRETRRARLPLAGVPVAVKDNVDVAGMPTRGGSHHADAGPATTDHPVVARLRAAGAVIVGKTRVPELCLWGTTSGAAGAARSPWAPHRTAGGSSGGSAAAVAAGITPVAHGNDGLGSLRIPAACCGLIGLKPGMGVVPSALGVDSWFGMAENGVLATTVADTALVLAVMAGDPTLAVLRPPARPLRIALALRPPAHGFTLDQELAAHTRAVAAALAAAGHEIVETAPPMPSPRTVLAVLATWSAGAAREVDAILAEAPAAWSGLERRTRVHARLGRLALRAGLVRAADRARWRAALEAFLAPYDVLLTPTLAHRPPAADGWHRRGWLANLVTNLRYAPYCGPVNFATLPAIAVPAGQCADGTPASAHLVAPAGGERVLLGLAAEIEQRRPWPLHPPAGPLPSTAAHAAP